MKTVGLFKEDTRIYFVNDNFVVMKDPDNEGIALCKRHPGELTKEDYSEIVDILLKTGMKAKGNVHFREDGLWCCTVEGR